MSYLDKTADQSGTPQALPAAPVPVAAIDIGASAVRLVVATVAPGQRPVILEEATRGVLLGRDTFSTGRIGAATLDATVRALIGFRQIMSGYGVGRVRAVATSAVREAANADTVLDRVRVRTGVTLEIIDESEESRLTYLAVRTGLAGHPALAVANALLVEVGGGSVDLTILERGRPTQSGVYPLGAIRLRQRLAAWHGPHDQRIRLLAGQIATVIRVVAGQMSLGHVTHVIALGSDMRFAASRLVEHDGDRWEISRPAFLAFCAEVERYDEDQLVERFRLSPVDAETLVPAMLVYRHLLLATVAAGVTVPDLSLRAGLLVELTESAGDQSTLDALSEHVLESAVALGNKYRFDKAHAHLVGRLAARLFDDLAAEHGLSGRDRLLLQVAALLHDIGLFVSLRGHHKHSQYLLQTSEIFGLSRDDMNLVGNIARYHRRGLPQKAHEFYGSLDRAARVRVNKLAAILRLANALDAEHLQKVVDVRLREDEGTWVVDLEGRGDLTMERLAAAARADLLTDVFGKRVIVRGFGSRVVTDAADAIEGSGLFFNRELSWLAFNARVLEEARARGNPLLEQVKFATIVASNLDEFFMVRVAGLKDAVRKGDTRTDPSGMTPAQQLEAISLRSHAMVTALYDVVQSQLPALAAQGIQVTRVADLDAGARAAVAAYFHDEVLPALTPLAIDSARPFPSLASLTVNVAFRLRPAADSDQPRLAVVQVPARLPRLVRVAGGSPHRFVLLDDVIRAEFEALFPGQALLESAAFRLTRDSELELDDDVERPYLEALERGLRKRRRSAVVRLEIDKECSDEFTSWMAELMGVEGQDVYRLPMPLDIRALSALLDLPGYAELRHRPIQPVNVLERREEHEIFSILDERDLLLHHPYESFDPVVAFAEAAADDPDVLAIKQTLYRTGGDSPIVAALTRAADQGKQVTVLLELMARFDEQRNIQWARRLEEMGAHVIYGVRHYKMHAKVALVVRRTPTGLRRYVHLGTGNYNGATARLYTDFGLMTADPDFGADASAFFTALTGYSDPPRLRKLVMAPTALRSHLIKLIDRERRRAQTGQHAEIRAKMNSLVDAEIVRALYAASQAGVVIRLNVRGMCTLRPGVEGLSDRISVVSVVGRYLEHARVFVFQNGGTPAVYLSSADWMPRNLDKRIEMMFPVEAHACRRKVLDSLDAIFRDNVKGRRLLPTGEWITPRPSAGTEPFEAHLHLPEVAARDAAGVHGAVFEPLGKPPV